MQQEDDLRGLAKVMEFMRAISIMVSSINSIYPLVSDSRTL